MIRRTRRKSSLGPSTRDQVQNLLSASVPAELQQLLADLHSNLGDVHNLIDRQLQQTRALSARAYADLRSPTQSSREAQSQVQDPSSSIESAAKESSPEGSSMMNEQLAAVQQHLGQINLAINQKVMSMTQEIAARTQQVHASAAAVQEHSNQDLKADVSDLD